MKTRRANHYQKVFSSPVKIILFSLGFAYQASQKGKYLPPLEQKFIFRKEPQWILHEKKGENRLVSIVISAPALGQLASNWNDVNGENIFGQITTNFQPSHLRLSCDFHANLREISFRISIYLLSSCNLWSESFWIQRPHERHSLRLPVIHYRCLCRRQQQPYICIISLMNSSLSCKISCHRRMSPLRQTLNLTF